MLYPCNFLNLSVHSDRSINSPTLWEKAAAAARSRTPLDHVEVYIEQRNPHNVRKLTRVSRQHLPWLKNENNRKIGRKKFPRRTYFPKKIKIVSVSLREREPVQSSMRVFYTPVTSLICRCILIDQSIQQHYKIRQRQQLGQELHWTLSKCISNREIPTTFVRWLA